MKTRILIREGQYRLNKAGCLDPKVDSEELFSFLTGMDRVEIFVHGEEEVDPEIERRYMKLIRRREERVPLQHITGEQEFMGFRFMVSPDVLIPRQDTETLVAEAARTLKEHPGKKPGFFERLRGKGNREVLDLCCGSGIIGISLWRIAGDIDLIASDISQEAIALAERNARINHVEGEFLQGDLFEPHKGRQFDMILTNPPYIKTNMIGLLQDEIKKYEPRNALDGGRDGLDYYRRIVEEAPNHLKKDGFLVMEIGYDQGDDLGMIIDESGAFKDFKVIKDLAGRDRVVRCRKA